MYQGESSHHSTLADNNEEQPRIYSSSSRTTSGTLDAIIALLQNATPGMGALTRFLDRLDTNDLALNRQTRDMLIRGMEYRVSSLAREAIVAHQQILVEV